MNKMLIMLLPWALCITSLVLAVALAWSETTRMRQAYEANKRVRDLIQAILWASISWGMIILMIVITIHWKW